MRHISPRPSIEAKFQTRKGAGAGVVVYSEGRLEGGRKKLQNKLRISGAPVTGVSVTLYSGNVK